MVIKLYRLKNEEDYRTYKQSLLFVLITAAHELYPMLKLRVHQSVGKSTYCELGNGAPTNEILGALKRRMSEIIKSDVPFKTICVTKKEAQNIFNKQGDSEKAQKLEYSMKKEICLCETNSKYTTLYGRLEKTTGALSSFDLTPFSNGFLLRYPNNETNGKIPPFVASRKLIETILEYRRWEEIANIKDVFELNRFIREKRFNEIINLSEALHEKRISHIADDLKALFPKVRVVLISGPSSSGKTTFAGRLGIHLRVNEIKPATISLDDYFLDREDSPLHEDGSYNFEDLDALDYNLFNEHLKKLIQGEEVEIPRYSFQKGKREEKGRKLKLSSNEILIIEGIHALNDKLTYSIDHDSKYKIYCTPLTVMSFDEYNPISPTDTRLLRRIVRDYKYRNCKVQSTFELWPSVRRGEIKNIFPFEEGANAIFNSALTYEFSVIKPIAGGLLKELNERMPDFETAARLLEFLSSFEVMPKAAIPPMSIMREFIGGSSI